MVPFTNPFRWRIWPWLWFFITDLIREISLITTVKPSICEDGCKEMATSGKSKNSVMCIKVPKGHLTTGFSGIICKIDEETIAKYPKVIPNDHSRSHMFRDIISKERKIYERLGDHQGIISYLGIHDESTGAIKLEYAQQGDLERYIQTHEMPPEATRTAWIQSLVKTFQYIYSRRILHRDVKPNNILVKNGNLKVTDFGNADMYPLNTDMKNICENDPLSRIDILGLGCIIYSIAAWKIFYYDYYENERWPGQPDLPSTSGLIFGAVIKNCWEEGRYDTIECLYEDLWRIRK